MTAMRPSTRVRGTLQLIAAYVALAVIGIVQAAYATHVFLALTQPQKIARQPFTYDRERRVDWAQSKSRKAGLQLGDQVLAVDAMPFTSETVLAKALQRRGPNTLLPVLIERSPGQNLLLNLPLQPMPQQKAFLFAFLDKFCLSVFCTLLALWIVAARPLESVGWLFLALLISFSMLVVEPGWPWPFRIAAITYQSVIPETLGIWLLLFGIRFPSVPDWRPWFLWPVRLLIAVIAVVVTLDAAITLTNQIDFSLLPWLRVYYPDLQVAINLLVFASLIAYAILLVLKMKFVGKHSDLYRRIQLIAAGATVGLGPTMLIVVGNYVRGPDASPLPQWMVVAAACLLLVFPLSLAYVLIVHRALGLRVILRDTLKRLSDSQHQGFLREFSVAALFACGLEIFHPPSLLAAAAPLLLLYLLLHFRVLQAAGLWIDRHLFRESYKAEQLLLQTLERVGPLDSASPMLDKLVHRISSAMQADTVAVLLRSADSFTVHQRTGNLDLSRVAFSATGTLAAWLSEESRPLRLYADDPSSPRYRLPPEESSQLALLNTQVMLPLRGTRDLLGVLSLGPRLWDQAYSQMDLRLLSALANECCLVLENSELVHQLTQEIHQRERKHAEKLAAEQAAKTKSDLLAQMSHELRTPLNAILGYSEMLTEEAEELGATHMLADLGKIHSAGKHLLNLINAVLDMAKLESGATVLCLEIFSLERLTREAAGIAAPLMSRNKNQLVLDIEPGLGAMEADMTKLRQVILNLLSNAAKFTSNGTVTLRVAVQRVEDVGWAEIEVHDTGMGMTEEQITRLCVPFRQADASIARKFGGTGLGLAISRQFCQLMGGDIAISSHIGQGSSFTIRLPIAVSNYQKTLVAKIPQAGGQMLEATILVIDDDPIMYDLVERFVGGLPVRVLHSATASEGLEAAAAEQPSCILLDIILPDKDGWSVLRELKADPRTASIPVVVCSIIGDRNFALVLGAADYLNKPIMRGDLLRSITPLMWREEPSASAHPPPETLNAVEELSL